MFRRQQVQEASFEQEMRRIFTTESLAFCKGCEFGDRSCRGLTPSTGFPSMASSGPEEWPHEQLLNEGTIED